VSLLSPDAFLDRLRDVGARRYHDRHPFHQRLHSGRCSRGEVQAWALNRYAYQAAIPRKDATLIARLDDPALRRAWRQRLVDHDGGADGEGGIERWLRLNKKPIPPDSADSRTIGFDAHRSVKNVYVNRGRAKLTRPNGRQRLPYPPGTILVKTGRTGSTVTLVAIMRKIKGFDPRHGDWQFVEYKRSSADQRFTTSASLRDGTCWGCHATVAKDDWVFTALDR
jgi:hypothetical protein